MSELSPELLKKIWEWHEAEAALAALKAREMELRAQIMAAVFLDPKIGTNTAELPDGWKLKGVAKVNVKIDEPALDSMKEKLREGGIVLEEVIRYKPDLVAGAYKEYPEHQRKLIDLVLIKSPGSPSLELVPPPKPRGKKN